LNVWAMRAIEWRLETPALEVIMRSDLGRLMPERGKQLADQARALGDGGLADRLLAIGRDCAARLGDEYRSLDHDAVLYDEEGLPR